jgi:hypothetical protein
MNLLLLPDLEVGHTTFVSLCVLSMEFLYYLLFIIYLSLDLPLLKHKSGLDQKYSY